MADSRKRKLSLRPVARAGIALIASSLTVTASDRANTPIDSASPISGRAAAAALDVFPLRFEPNVGQSLNRYRYVARTQTYGIALAENEVSLRLEDRSPARGWASDRSQHSVPPVALALHLVGSTPEPRISAEGRQPSVSNYLIGNEPSAWHRRVANFGAVRYEKVYPGVDWVLYGNAGELEYDFVLAPGADPAR